MKFPNAKREENSEFLRYVTERIQQLDVAFQNRMEYLKTKSWRARKYNSLTHTVEERKQELTKLEEQVKTLKEEIDKLQGEMDNITKEEKEAEKAYLLDERIYYEVGAYSRF